MRPLLLFLLVSVLVVLLTPSINGVPSESLVLHLTLSTAKSIRQECGREAGSGDIPILGYFEQKGNSLVNIRVPAMEGMECEMWREAYCRFQERLFPLGKAGLGEN
jgi:hypothetical protein